MESVELVAGGKKELLTAMRFAQAFDELSGSVVPVTTFPMDSAAKAIFYTKAGGFVDPTSALDSILSAPAHYGLGFFEGIRKFDSPWGSVFPELSSNIGRALHSATLYDPQVQLKVLEFFKDERVEAVELFTPTARQLFEHARERYRDGKDFCLPIKLHYREDGKKHTRTILLPIQLNVVFGNEVRQLGMMEIDAAIKVLTYLNGLVSDSYFPGLIEPSLASYIRPFGWISAEKGLKVPTLLVEDGKLTSKPLYFAIASLPWPGTYLDASHYAGGLDAFIPPYPRVGPDMPTDRKAAGQYVNSAMCANLAIMFGYGEALVLNNDGEPVEGSAENLLTFFRDGKRLVCVSPPVDAGVLPGTNRDMAERIVTSEMDMEFRYSTYPLSSLRYAKAVILLGTGVQNIHLRSVKEIPAAEKLARARRLRSETNGAPSVIIRRGDFKPSRNIGINGGERHEVVDQFRAARARYLMRNGGEVFDSVADIRLDALARLFGLDESDIGTEVERDRHRELWGPINGLEQSERLTLKLRTGAALVKSAIEMDIRRRKQQCTQRIRRNGHARPLPKQGAF